MMTTNQIAGVLGYTVNYTLQILKKHNFKPYRQGRTFFYKKEDIEKLIALLEQNKRGNTNKKGKTGVVFRFPKKLRIKSSKCKDQEDIKLDVKKFIEIKKSHGTDWVKPVHGHTKEIDFLVNFDFGDLTLESLVSKEDAEKIQNFRGVI